MNTLKYNVGSLTVIVDHQAVNLNYGDESVVITDDNFYREQFKFMVATILLAKVDCSSTMRFLAVVNILPLPDLIKDEMKALYVNASRKMFERTLPEQAEPEMNPYE